MSEKRRDNKNRVLRNGESQRSDGRYAYKYIDTDGKQQFVYSWKLEKTDRLPKGKRDDLSLREKEKQIQKDLEDMISTSGGDITVLALVEKYTSQRKGMRHSTKAGYKTVLNVLAKDDFGRRQIRDVRLSDAKEWLIRLQGNGKGYSSIQTIRGVVRPAFQMAVDDDLIRRKSWIVSGISLRAVKSRKRSRLSVMRRGGCIMASCSWTRMEGRWLPCIGKSICSISGRSTTRSIKYRCRM